MIFDLDGTLVDSERHGHRVAFNQAFEEFDLPYRWDEETYGELLRITGGRRRIARYLESEGVAEGERDKLSAALHERKTEILKQMVAEGRVEARPGVHRLLAELGDGGCRLAIATTGSRGWVDGLLDQVLGGTSRFEVIVTGDEVEERKPDPEAFTLAMERLSIDSGAVVVEDSAEGLEAARAAGLPCVVVVNGYTADHDLSGADLVLDGFGEPGEGATVLADRRDTGCTGVLDAGVLRRLLERAK
ncbi:MAG: HAD-IA family hydrolase [Actinomycetota bacterium]|nr:HAD-IA family hydrolase [Actinomycetota bacterium]